MAFPMAVRATNFTFFDFCLYCVPGVTEAYHSTNFHAFFPANMIEIKTNRIGFTAIDAWMQFQVIHYPFALLLPDPLRSQAGFANVIGLVSLIMHLN